MNKRLLPIKDAALWASKYLKRSITPSNISYLVQYAKVKKYQPKKGAVFVDVDELKSYYDQFVIEKESEWKKKLGSDLNWALSFDQLREVDTTKHVHRLHPYKGKFIPQLVEYFLDTHINTFKKKAFFKKGDVILDPFMGSGTTLVQCAELGLHSIGIDISEFNCLIAGIKVADYDLDVVKNDMQSALENTRAFSLETFDNSYDNDQKERIAVFNKKYFPSPVFKYRVKDGRVDEKSYGKEKLELFLKENKEFLKKGSKRKLARAFEEKQAVKFLTRWFSPRICQELFFYLKQIEGIEEKKTQDLMHIVLSRTARSCRATTHSDLATLKKPQYAPYYCRKHKKICTPINGILKHLSKNTQDTLKRLKEYNELKTDVSTAVLHADSREVDIVAAVKKEQPTFARLLKKQKISGVFTSPPYVGHIDYHEQHAYSYELFNIPRKDDKEIGPKSKGKGKNAQEEYVNGISKVLKNISPFVKDSGDFFIVANDKFSLYPLIAKKSGLRIVQTFKRPVLNRTERDRQPYAEFIFHMKKEN